MAMQLETKNVTVAYDDYVAIENISFSLKAGEIGCLLGPSGCGKTSLLRAIAGFEPLLHGEICLHGKTVSVPGNSTPTEQRRVGMVFQDFALFPHLSVEKNIAFGLKHLDAKQCDKRVDELLKLVGLTHLKMAYPHELSGGQQQRIALIRAMAPRPEILLMDEPFSSMDAELREQLAREVRELLKRDGITALLVTHDQLEAFAMADVIGVFGNGELHQWDSGYQIYHKPANRFVADFIGQGVMLPGKIIYCRMVETEMGVFDDDLPDDFELGSQVEVLLRPDDVIHDDDSDTKLEVTAKTFRGAEYLYTLALPSGHSILCLVQSHHNHKIGERIGIKLNLEDLAVFPVCENTSSKFLNQNNESSS